MMRNGRFLSAKKVALRCWRWYEPKFPQDSIDLRWVLFRRDKDSGDRTAACDAQTVTFTTIRSG